MKKLMIAAAVAMVAVASQAVQAVWGSGYFLQPDANGALTGIEWNGTKWIIDNTAKITTAGAVEAFVWESTKDLTFSSGDLYKWYSEGKQGTPFEGITALTATSANGAANVNSAINWDTKADAYAAILYVYTDVANNKVWYQENDFAGQIGTSKTTFNLLSDFVGGGNLNTESQTLNSWTAAPEPTSGLLLLIGVGALALRRRRA